MRTKVLIGIAAVLLIVAFVVPNAFAALNDTQKGELDNLYKQMFELRKKMVDIYVQSGDLTADQGKLIKERIDQTYEYRKSQGFVPGAGCGVGGCGGGGCGMRGGWGGGFGLGVQNY